MAQNRVIGLKKIYLFPLAGWNGTSMPAANTQPSENTDYAHWFDCGDVYMDSATLVDDDPEVVIHKSETSARKITVSRPGDLKMTMQLMDPTYEELVAYFGGAIVTAPSGDRTWERPSEFQAKPFAIWIVPTEGDVLKCPVVGISSKFNITYS